MECTAKKEVMKYAIEYKSDGGINVNDDGRGYLFQKICKRERT